MPTKPDQPASLSFSFDMTEKEQAKLKGPSASALPNY